MNILRALTVILGAAIALGAVRDPQYSEAKVVDIFGTVENIREVSSGATLPGLHLNVRKDKRTMIDVYLGPADYVAGFSVHFQHGDVIEAVGSKVRNDGSEVLLAREVRKSDSTVYLRDDHGNPLWSK